MGPPPTEGRGDIIKQATIFLLTGIFRLPRPLRGAVLGTNFGLGGVGADFRFLDEVDFSLICWFYSRRSLNLFSSASKLESLEQSYKAFTTKTGTERYMAPECCE